MSDPIKVIEVSLFQGYPSTLLYESYDFGVIDLIGEHIMQILMSVHSHHRHPVI